MEEQVNLTQDDVLDLIGGEGFPEQPLFNKVIVTLNKEEVDGGLVLSDNTLSEIQYVVAAGNTSQVQAGQKVRLDLERMTVKVRVEENNSYETVEQIKIDPIIVNDTMYAIIEDRFIKTKVNW